MRGWEWRYLVGRCRSDESALLGHHYAWIADVAVSPDGKWIGSISEEGVVKLWDFSTRTETQSWRAHTKPAKDSRSGVQHAIAFSADSQVLATGGADRAVHLWDVLSPDKRRTL